MEQCALTSLGTIAFLPPPGVKDRTVSTSFSCALGCIRDLLLVFPSSWAGTAPFTLLSFDATGKSFRRWRLAPAQEAARGTPLRSLFVVFSVVSYVR